MTPRGGGLAIVVTAGAGVAAGFVAAPASFAAQSPAWWLAAAACLLLAGIGLVDDLRSLSYRTRLLAQAVAVGTVAWSAATSTAALVDDPVLIRWAAAGAVVVVGVWWVNLFNFMDGIDGIAGCEAVFLLGCVWLTEPVPMAAIDASRWCAGMLIAAVIGFLPLNWYRGRIFLGDCGSLFLGVAILFLAMHGVTRGHTSGWFWAIVAGAFVSDATVTLIRRLLSGIDVTSAHRSHLYQGLARRWRNHAKVTLVYSAANLAWFLPLALLARHWPISRARPDGRRVCPRPRPLLVAGRRKVRRRSEGTE